MSAVSFKATEADLIAAYRLHFLDSITRKRAWVRFLIGAAICAALSVFVFGDDFGVFVAAPLGASYWFAFLTLIFGGNFLLLPGRVRRIYAQQKSLHGEATVEWSDENISFQTPRGNSRLCWSDFVRLLENRNIIVLMQSDAAINFIPKAALSDEQAASIMSHKASVAA